MNESAAWVEVRAGERESGIAVHIVRQPIWKTFHLNVTNDIAAPK